MGANHNRLIILKTTLPDKFGDALLNTWAMGDKGGQKVMKVCPAVCPDAW
jgi:hypothetical protein